MKPVVSIVIPTLGRDTLYPLIKKLLNQKTKLSYEIVLIPQVPLKENLLRDKRIKIHYEPLGKGFAYYRNTGIRKSKGNIIAFIDDDELPLDNFWISSITKLILDKKGKVVTAGVKIMLGQGYFTDCISLLGFPGGGAIGFKTMWFVDSNNYTEHLCSGNLAIDRRFLLKIGAFDNKLKSGNEDVNLADKIIKAGIKIKYLEEATVEHVARKGIINFMKWHYLRGSSIKKDPKHPPLTKDKVSNRLKSSVRVLRKTFFSRFFLGVLFLMIGQYVCHVLGYFGAKIK